MRLRTVLPAALAAALLALSGGTARAGTVYFPNYYGPPEAIPGFAFAPDGSLAPLPGSPFPLPGAASGLMGLAFTPDGKRAVSTFLFKGGVLGLSVAPDGSLAPPLGPTPTPSVVGLAVSPDGRFAYASTRDFNGVAAVGILGFEIAADGSLTEMGGSPFGSGEYGDVAITPDGRFLFAMGGGGIRRFAVDADGGLAEVGTPTPSSAVSLEVSPDGRFLFAGVDQPDGVASFAIAADGGLTQNGPPALTGGTGLGFIGVAPDGRNVYMPDGAVDGIVRAAVAEDGTLTVAETTPAEEATGAAVSPDGRLLYYARAGTPGLVGAAALDADGVPTPLPSTAEWYSGTGEPERVVPGPAPAPEASYQATEAVPGRVTSFDASASDRAARFDWDFGDGSTLADGGPTPEHRYAEAGVYAVRLTVTDADGCSTRLVYTGHSTVCPGGPSATETVSLDTRPALSALSATRRGTALRYTLSEASKVRFTIERKRSGRRVRRLRRVGTFTVAARQGRNRTRVPRRLRGRRLGRGAYRVTAVATDPAGGKSAARSVSLRIARR